MTNIERIYEANRALIRGLSIADFLLLREGMLSDFGQSDQFFKEARWEPLFEAGLLKYYDRKPDMTDRRVIVTEAGRIAVDAVAAWCGPQGLKTVSELGVNGGRNGYLCGELGKWMRDRCFTYRTDEGDKLTSQGESMVRLLAPNLYGEFMRWIGYDNLEKNRADRVELVQLNREVLLELEKLQTEGGKRRYFVDPIANNVQWAYEADICGAIKVTPESDSATPHWELTLTEAGKRMLAAMDMESIRDINVPQSTELNEAEESELLAVWQASPARCWDGAPEFSKEFCTLHRHGFVRRFGTPSGHSLDICFESGEDYLLRHGMIEAKKPKNISASAVVIPIESVCAVGWGLKTVSTIDPAERKFDNDPKVGKETVAYMECVGGMPQTIPSMEVYADLVRTNYFEIKPDESVPGCITVGLTSDGGDYLELGGDVALTESQLTFLRQLCQKDDMTIKDNLSPEDAKDLIDRKIIVAFPGLSQVMHATATEKAKLLVLFHSAWDSTEAGRRQYFEEHNVPEIEVRKYEKPEPDATAVRDERLRIWNTLSDADKERLREFRQRIGRRFNIAQNPRAADPFACLAAAGLIESCIDPRDNAILRLRITEQGIAVYDEYLRCNMGADASGPKVDFVDWEMLDAMKDMLISNMTGSIAYLRYGSQVSSDLVLKGYAESRYGDVRTREDVDKDRQAFNLTMKGIEFLTDRFGKDGCKFDSEQVERTELTADQMKLLFLCEEPTFLSDKKSVQNDLDLLLQNNIVAEVDNTAGTKSYEATPFGCAIINDNTPDSITVAPLTKKEWRALKRVNDGFNAIYGPVPAVTRALIDRDFVCGDVFKDVTILQFTHEGREYFNRFDRPYEVGELTDFELAVLSQIALDGKAILDNQSEDKVLATLGLIAGRLVAAGRIDGEMRLWITVDGLVYKARKTLFGFGRLLTRDEFSVMHMIARGKKMNELPNGTHFLYDKGLLVYNPAALIYQFSATGLLYSRIYGLSDNVPEPEFKIVARARLYDADMGREAWYGVPVCDRERVFLDAMMKERDAQAVSLKAADDSAMKYDIEKMDEWTIKDWLKNVDMADLEVILGLAHCEEYHKEGHVIVNCLPLIDGAIIQKLIQCEEVFGGKFRITFTPAAGRLFELFEEKMRQADAQMIEMMPKFKDCPKWEWPGDIGKRVPRNVNEVYSVMPGTIKFMYRLFGQNLDREATITLPQEVNRVYLLRWLGIVDGDFEPLVESDRDSVKIRLTGIGKDLVQQYSTKIANISLLPFTWDVMRLRSLRAWCKNAPQMLCHLMRFAAMPEVAVDGAVRYENLTEFPKSYSDLIQIEGWLHVDRDGDAYILKLGCIGRAIVHEVYRRFGSSITDITIGIHRLRHFESFEHWIHAEADVVMKIWYHFRDLKHDDYLAVCTRSEYETSQLWNRACELGLIVGKNGVDAGKIAVMLTAEGKMLVDDLRCLELNGHGFDVGLPLQHYFPTIALYSPDILYKPEKFEGAEPVVKMMFAWNQDILSQSWPDGIRWIENFFGTDLRTYESSLICQWMIALGWIKYSKSDNGAIVGYELTERGRHFANQNRILTAEEYEAGKPKIVPIDSKTVSGFVDGIRSNPEIKVKQLSHTEWVAKYGTMPARKEEPVDEDCDTDDDPDEDEMLDDEGLIEQENAIEEMFDEIAPKLEKRRYGLERVDDIAVGPEMDEIVMAWLDSLDGKEYAEFVKLIQLYLVNILEADDFWRAEAFNPPSRIKRFIRDKILFPGVMCGETGKVSLFMVSERGMKILKTSARLQAYFLTHPATETKDVNIWNPLLGPKSEHLQ